MIWQKKWPQFTKASCSRGAGRAGPRLCVTGAFLGHALFFSMCPSIYSFLQNSWNSVSRAQKQCWEMSDCTIGNLCGSRGKGQGAKEMTSCAFQYWKNPQRNKRALHKGKSRERLCPAVRVVSKAPSLILIPALFRFYNTEILGCFNGCPYQQHQGPPSEFVQRD